MWWRFKRQTNDYNLLMRGKALQKGWGGRDKNPIDAVCILCTTTTGCVCNEEVQHLNTRKHWVLEHFYSISIHFIVSESIWLGTNRLVTHIKAQQIGTRKREFLDILPTSHPSIVSLRFFHIKTLIYCSIGYSTSIQVEYYIENLCIFCRLAPSPHCLVGIACHFASLLSQPLIITPCNCRSIYTILLHYKSSFDDSIYNISICYSPKGYTDNELTLEWPKFLMNKHGQKQLVFIVDYS